ncbi:hypothetical protein HELRODRAFT_165821 [Helobdella robusta]|uniref:Uncharacterized protein n=1 Tax=Helobdella robusta TaxID=6412 RepID=T1EXB9_HELRO|nr:hypothetical protein HELRODRAFT_165821 [Helobdella robusta]ESN91752.1 hypothetical protein HELRODRAFT_165821 [Helobdella robusta]
MTSTIITGDYCQSEYFIAVCNNSLNNVNNNNNNLVTNVVVITKATYGRMRVSRCVTGMYGDVGCRNDVTNYVSSRCSGKSRCKIYVAEQMLHRLNRCPIELNAYLEEIRIPILRKIALQLLT